MSTIRGWWTEDRALTQKFFNRDLGRPGEAPLEATPEIVEAVVRQHLASPAMWSIFQLQDLLGLDGGLRRSEHGCRAYQRAGQRRISIGDTGCICRWKNWHGAEPFNSQLARLLRETGR